MSILVVIPCHEGDQDQALRLLNWIAELGQVQANAMLFCSNECDVATLMKAGSRAFTNIRHEVDAENFKCNWQSDDPGPRNPAGPNSVFRQVAWSIYMTGKKEPWLFLEPDSIPLCRDWYNRLVKEYDQASMLAGKIVMGDMVSTNSPHLSGVAVYPWNVPEVFPKMVHNVEGAFDTSSAKVVLANAHITPLIMDRWRSPEFKTESDFNRIRQEACLFHASKDGSLIKFVRQKLGIQAPYTKEQLETKGPEFETNRQFARAGAFMDAMIDPTPEINRAVDAVLSAPDDGAVRSVTEFAMRPVVDIYLKTYPKDYELANYCLKSIAKFVTGVRNIIIEAPDNGRYGTNQQTTENTVVIPFGWLERITWVKSEDRQPGYIDQQAKKLAAFKHTDSEYLLYIDSDCCFQRPFDVSEMFKGHLPTWQYTPFTHARRDQFLAWGPVMQAFLGKIPEHEFMRRHPHIIPRWLPEEMDKFCRYKHGVTLDQYIMAQGDPSQPLQLSFSEFNCSGFFAWEFFRDRFSWVTDAEATPAPVVQGFTHGGPDRIKADIEQFKKILGEDQPKDPFPDIPKWEWPNGKFPENMGSCGDIDDIGTALKWLAAEASKSPLHKARLMKRITAALAGERKPQAPKRRRKGAKKIGPWKEAKKVMQGSVDRMMPMPPKRKRGRPRKASLNG